MYKRQIQNRGTFNYESNINSEPSSEGLSNYSIWLDDAGEAKFRKRLGKWSNKKYSLFGANCTNFALSIWNNSSGQPLPGTHFPAFLQNAIDRRNGD